MSKVLPADDACLAHGLAGNMVRQVLALVGSYSHIFFPPHRPANTGTSRRGAAAIE